MVNYRKIDLTYRQKAMIDYEMKVCQQAHKIGDGDAAILKSHGFTDENIWDIAAVSEFFSMSNRLANATAMRPNDAFFTMGR